jgi:hypothetical protein
MIGRTVAKIVDRCQLPVTRIGEECRGPSRGLYESFKAHPPYRSGALEGYKPGAFFGLASLSSMSRWHRAQLRATIIPPMSINPVPTQADSGARSCKSSTARARVTAPLRRSIGATRKASPSSRALK